MKYPSVLAFLFAVLCNDLIASDWYVSTNGAGNGSIGNPWFLQTALTNTSVHPGDTIWLRGGTYFPISTFADWDMHPLGWQPKIAGVTNSLITLRSYTNEWAAIDRRWDLKNGPSSYLRFLNLEFFDSLKGHNLTNNQYPNGPWVHFPGGTATGFEWINCVIHDVGCCFGGGGAGNSVRGCIFWYVGWTLAEHVCYGPPPDLSGNIAAFDYDTFIEHSFNTLVARNNIVFGTGKANGTAGSTRVLLFDGAGALVSNYFYDYFSSAVDGYPTTIGSLGAVTNTDTLTIASNIVASADYPLAFSANNGTNYSCVVQGNTFYRSQRTGPVMIWAGNIGSVTIDYNSYYAYNANLVINNIPAAANHTFVQWQTYYPAYDVHSTEHPSSAPSDSTVIIPNQDQAKRCHIAIYNFSHADNVSVSLSGVLNPGDTYQLFSAQNYNAGPIKSGNFGGSTISVPMTNLTTAPMISGTNMNHWLATPSQPTPTSPEFGAFVLIGQAPTVSSAGTINVINGNIGTLRTP
jgi:hypothetical protein